MGLDTPPKTTKGHWLSAGMALLVARGPDSISVEQLCQQVGLTKGSFYHHFKDHPQFVDELVADWQQQNLHQPINESTNGSGQARLSTLTALSAALDPEQEIAVRRLASRNDKVRAVLALVDEARMDYLATLYREAGLKPRQAADAAKIQYAGFVGAQSLWPHEFGAQVQKLGKIVDKLLMARNNSASADNCTSTNDVKGGSHTASAGSGRY